MKITICLFVVTVLCGVVYTAPGQSTYTTKYDNVDLDAIIKNDRLLRSYVDCLLGKKTCTNDGEELKKVVPDALKNRCAKCDDKQKEGAKKMMRHLIKNKQEWFNELEAIYDPEGIYRKEYKEEAAKAGIELH